MRRTKTAIVTLALTMLVSLAATGCELTDVLLDTSYGLYPSYGYFDYGFMPDAATIQSVNDYRSDVFDSANDAWDDYIRARRK